HFVNVVDFCQFDLNHFIHGGLNCAANVGSLDRQFTVAAVDQYQQLYPTRTAMKEERVHGRTYIANREEHIVNQNDLLVANGKTDLRFLYHRLRTQCRKIVAIEGDIKRADRYGNFLPALDYSCQPFGDWNTAAADTY